MNTEITVTNTPADVNLASIAVPALTGIVLQAAYVMIEIGCFRETASSSNNMSGLVEVDTAAGGWITASTLTGNFIKALSDESNPYGGVNHGDVNIIAKVGLGETTDIRLGDIAASSFRFKTGLLR